jgi:hypothetical protein
MLRRLPLFVGLAVLAAGCAKPLEVSNITEIKPHTGSKGLDVYEPKRLAGKSAVPEFAGDQLVEVRTYTYKDDSGEVEIAGATCSLSAADYSATMQTPAKVRVPLYRGQSSTLAVACEMPGYKKRMVTISPYDATRSARYGAGAGTGLIGFVAVTAIDAFSDNTKNEWRYPLARVVLELDETGDKVASTR